MRSSSFTNSIIHTEFHASICNRWGVLEAIPSNYIEAQAERWPKSCLTFSLFTCAKILKSYNCPPYKFGIKWVLSGFFKRFWSFERFPATEPLDLIQLTYRIDSIKIKIKISSVKFRKCLLSHQNIPSFSSPQYNSVEPSKPKYA